MIIYRATNLVNNKIYIGKTESCLTTRKAQHVYEATHNVNNTYFHKAIRKYGKENFLWDIIHVQKKRVKIWQDRERKMGFLVRRIQKKIEKR